jgi:hypothetical protein
MPRNKDFKRLVRARMRKTGESYTTSRAKLIARTSARSKPVTAVAEKPSARPPRIDYAALAGTADATIKAKTGCTWERWVAALDYHGADKMAHRDIAALVNSKYKIDGWWSQAVTVGYERIKGLRAIGQRRDGTYEANKTRTYNVPIATLFDAWADARVRKTWLDDTIGRVRTSVPKKSIRFDGPKGSIVAVGFMPKGASKSVVAVQHTKLGDSATASQLKKYWSERLDKLAGVL